MRTFPSSPPAARALGVVELLQATFTTRLEQVSGEVFQPTEWLRDDGLHGGGTRFSSGGNPSFDRASINVSAIHYDDLPEKRLAGATALSAIVHPANPHAPSMHIHISHTEMRGKHEAPGKATWRIMADLNPSVPYDADRDAFAATLRRASGALYAEAADQGDRYFFVPALKRHRGVCHFYLESWTSGDPEHDEALSSSIGEAVIDRYVRLIEPRMLAPVTDEHTALQLAYHTLYLFQVLTLDRGTTSGLLVHSQNDVGIMGSLPSVVDPALLGSWAAKVPSVQRPLVEALVAILSPSGQVTIAVKEALAAAVRKHYSAHPEALSLQARGNVVPPTVANHERA